MTGATTRGLPRTVHRRLDIHDAKGIAADLAVLATFATVIALFAVSPVTMEHFGLSYITPGGSPLGKFHPATILAVGALGLRCLATRHPGRTAWRLVTGDHGVVVFEAAIAVTAFYAIAISKTPVTPLFDTFVLPVLCLMLLRDLDRSMISRLALIVAAILVLNAAIALYEFLRHVHVVTLPVPDGVSSDPTRGDVIFDWRAELMQDWRATALLGHPLVNGLVVACFVTCLAARGASWMPAVTRVPLLLGQALAMFTFGARSSLVLMVVFAGALLTAQAVTALREGRRIPPRAIAYALIAIAVIAAALAIVNETGFFDRTVERFASDAGSAKTRFTMFELFGAFSWSDLFLGPDQDVVATWQRLYGLEFGIESSWVGLALAYGFVITAMISVGLFAFSRSVVRASGSGAAAVLLFFFVSVSGTASLSGKTTTLAMIVALILLFLRKAETRPTSKRAVRRYEGA